MTADSLRQVSDAAVVVAIGRWREDALAEAYRRHAGAVFALARRLLVDPGMAEEVVQEVFLRLWNQPEKFDPERGSLRAFLLAQTHGRAVDVLRSETSRRRREERDARRTAEAGYDIEREVMDLSVTDKVRVTGQRCVVLPAQVSVTMTVVHLTVTCLTWALPKAGGRSSCARRRGKSWPQAG